MTSEISLVAAATDVGCARVFVGFTLRVWGLECLREDAELVASELVTNAVQATGNTCPSPCLSDLQDLACIRLRLVVLGDVLIVEVWDRRTTPPVPKDAIASDAESGRGLLIVDSLSRRWDFYTPAEGGKWVWAELEIPPAPGPLRLAHDLTPV